MHPLLDRLKENRLYIAFGLGFYLVSLCLTGYAVHAANHALQIPFVRWLTDHAAYPSDYFTACLPYYCSMLWRAVAPLTGVFRLESIFFAGFLAERLLLIYAAARFARSLYPSSRLAVIGAMALMALPVQPILGSGTIVTPVFEQTGLSIPFFLLAGAAFYERRRYAFAVFMAVGFDLNSMYGAYAFTYFAAALLVERGFRAEWRAWVLPGLAGIALSMPAVYYSLEAMGHALYDRTAWLAASRFVLWLHLYPLTWNPAVFVKFFVFAAAALSLRAVSPLLFRQGAVWAGVGTLWLCLAFAAAYVLKAPSLLVLHPARATDLLYCFLGIALAGGFAVRLKAAPGKGRGWLAAGFGLSLVFLASLPDIQAGLIVAAVTVSLTAVPWFRDTAALPRRAGLLLLLVTGAFGFQRFAERGMTIAPPFRSETMAVASWAGTATAREAVFLVNPLWEDFRELSGRGVFATVKDGSAVLWYKPIAGEWVARMRLLGIDPAGAGPMKWTRTTAERYTAVYGRLGDAEVERIAAERRVDYWIVPADHPSAFPVLFTDGRHKVLAVPSRGGR